MQLPKVGFWQDTEVAEWGRWNSGKRGWKTGCSHPGHWFAFGCLLGDIVCAV